MEGIGPAWTVQNIQHHSPDFEDVPHRVSSPDSRVCHEDTEPWWATGGDGPWLLQPNATVHQCHEDRYTMPWLWQVHCARNYQVDLYLNSVVSIFVEVNVNINLFFRVYARTRHAVKMTIEQMPQIAEVSIGTWYLGTGYISYLTSSQEKSLIM